MASLSEDLRFRNLIHQVTDEQVLQRLDAGRLTVYGGFDPTAASLHVGSLLLLCLLRRLQLAGHRPIALAGGGTGAIGDPGGKAEERALQTSEQLDANLEGIRRQLSRFFELSECSGDPRPSVLVDNRDWLAPVGLLDFLRDIGKHFTVNQMVAKESVRARFERPDHGISFTEFSYMLLQAYDFLQLFDAYDCELQVGGSDQWGNITMGVELVRKVRHREVFGLTTPLVVKADGTKFGKTEEGTVWLDPARTSPYRFYQFFLRTEDAVVGDYLRYFTFLSHDEILDLDRQVSESPKGRAGQRVLAREVTVLVHGEAEAVSAERASRAIFEGNVAQLDPATLADVVGEIPSHAMARARLEGEGLELVDALVEASLAASRGQARRLASQGGVYVNDRREADPDRRITPADLLAGRFLVLRKGRHTYHVLCVTER